MPWVVGMSTQRWCASWLSWKRLEGIFTCGNVTLRLLRMVRFEKYYSYVPYQWYPFVKMVLEQLRPHPPPRAAILFAHAQLYYEQHPTLIRTIHLIARWGAQRNGWLCTWNSASANSRTVLKMGNGASLVQILMAALRWCCRTQLGEALIWLSVGTNKHLRNKPSCSASSIFSASKQMWRIPHQNGTKVPTTHWIARIFPGRWLTSTTQGLKTRRMTNTMMMISLPSLVTHPRLPLRTMCHLFVRLFFFTTESLTAFGTTFLVDLHTTRLARSALSH